MNPDWKDLIEKAWDNRSFLEQQEHRDAIALVIDALDKGKLRVAEPVEGKWILHEWIKKTVILYFLIRKMETVNIGPFEFHDKMD